MSPLPTDKILNEVKGRAEKNMEALRAQVRFNDFNINHKVHFLNEFFAFNEVLRIGIASVPNVTQRIYKRIMMLTQMLLIPPIVKYTSLVKAVMGRLNHILVGLRKSY